MFKAHVFSTSKRIIAALILLGVFSACTVQVNTKSVAPELQQLRITNSGDSDITGLVILFPGSSWDAEASRFEFGNIPAGHTTEYLDISSGVYRYAAYEYTLEGRIFTQFVIDWVGEKPMAGRKFTYQIALDPKELEGNQVNLITVLADNP